MADKEERIYICKTLKTDPCEVCESITRAEARGRISESSQM